MSGDTDQGKWHDRDKNYVWGCKKYFDKFSRKTSRDIGIDGRIIIKRILKTWSVKKIRNFVPKKERQHHETVLLHAGFLIRFFFDPEDEGFILHRFISQKKELFITTAMRTSNPILESLLFACGFVMKYILNGLTNLYKTLYGVCVTDNIFTNCIHTLNLVGYSNFKAQS
jgi:hypothetical protein